MHAASDGGGVYEHGNPILHERQFDMKAGFATNGRSMIDAANELFPILRANAAANESQRSISTASLDAIAAAGLWALLVPERWGGSAMPSATAASAVIAIASACPSTGWIFEIYTTGAWMPSLQADAVQEAVYACGPPLVAGSTALCPQAPVAPRVERVDGGVLVSGTWDYVSGCKNADWGSFGVPIVGDDRATRQVPVMIPFDRVQIEDNWNAAGMRGTGSHRAVMQQEFVPDHLILGSMAGTGRPICYPRERHCGTASDHLTFNTVYSVLTASVLIGAARGMLDEVLANVSRRGVAYTPYKQQIDSQVALHNVGEAALMIEAAEAMVMRCCDALDHHAGMAEPPPLALRQKVRGSTGYAGKLLRDASETLMTIGGASGFAADSILQRHWRDIAMASRHAVVNSNAAVEFYGRARAGILPALVENY